MKVLSVQNNSKNCMICGMENPFGLKAPFYNLEDGSVASILSFKSIHQSYPDRTHGGMVSALLDELMGRALWIDEPEMFGVTTTLNVVYRKATPLDAPVKARARITFNSVRGFVSEGQIFDMNDNLLVEASAKYFKIPFNKMFGENATFHEEMCYEMPLDIKEIDFPIINK